MTFKIQMRFPTKTKGVWGFRPLNFGNLQECTRKIPGFAKIGLIGFEYEIRCSHGASRLQESSMNITIRIRRTSFCANTLLSNNQNR